MSDMENEQRNRFADEVMESISGIRRAEAPVFLYTRAAARLEQPAALQGWIGRPVFSFGILILLVLVNVFTFLAFRERRTTEEESQGIRRFAAEYSLGTNAAYSN